MKKTNQKTLEEIIRVDHAGERGAMKIYEGQLLALKTIKQDLLTVYDLQGYGCAIICGVGASNLMSDMAI